MPDAPRPRPDPSPLPSCPPLTIRLAEIVAALSHALDITGGQLRGHAVRCAWIALHVGREAGLPEEDLPDLVCATLMKDLGCSSNAARICQLYLTDDLAFKHDVKRVGDSLPQVLRFVLSHTGSVVGLAERFRAVVNVLQNGGAIADDLMETRCQRGADIARKMRFSEAVVRGIGDLDEHWDGGGRPAGLRGEEVSPFARIALLAQVADVMQASEGSKAASREVRRRSGAWFDPRMSRAFERVAARPGFWEALSSQDLDRRLVAELPPGSDREVDDEYLDDIAEGFAEVIDAKSPFTSGHSRRVAVFADLVAAELGFASGRRRWLRRAALLHDIGKLGVSNLVLDKPGRLDEDEWRSVQRHPGVGEAILSRIGAFAGMAVVAGAHHERLDGTGYPRGLNGDAIGIETRIVSVADVFDALTAERPYRGPMPVAQALAIMREGVGAAFDPDCFAALARAMDGVDSRAA